MGEECCGGDNCGSHQSDDQKKNGTCCGGQCSNHQNKKSACCSDDNTKDGTCCNNQQEDDACGCGHDQELELSAEQIQRINTILGDIDDEDLETGNYDLTNEEAEELNAILFGKKEE